MLHLLYLDARNMDLRSRGLLFFFWPFVLADLEIFMRTTDCVVCEQWKGSLVSLNTGQTVMIKEGQKLLDKTLNCSGVQRI